MLLVCFKNLDKFNLNCLVVITYKRQTITLITPSWNHVQQRWWFIKSRFVTCTTYKKNSMKYTKHCISSMTALLWNGLRHDFRYSFWLLLCSCYTHNLALADAFRSGCTRRSQWSWRWCRSLGLTQRELIAVQMPHGPVPKAQSRQKESDYCVSVRVRVEVVCSSV